MVGRAAVCHCCVGSGVGVAPVDFCVVLSQAETEGPVDAVSNPLAGGVSEALGLAFADEEDPPPKRPEKKSPTPDNGLDDEPDDDDTVVEEPEPLEDWLDTVVPESAAPFASTIPGSFSPASP